MLFKDLQKLVTQSQQLKENTRIELSQRLQGKPFWIWNIEEHKQEDVMTDGDCCFNHIIGLPSKDTVDKPLYDYEKIIFNCLVTHDNNNSNSYNNKHLWIKKATGWGSSAFAIVVTEWVDGVVQILHAEEYHRPDYSEMLSIVYRLMSKYNIDKVYIDGANPSFIKSLKLQIGEDADYDKVIARYRSDGLGDNWSQDMKIVPVNFNSEHKAMLGHCKMILEDEGGKIAINPDRFDKLITALRTAVDNDGVLDKESTSYNDIFDAFRLALKFYRFEERTSLNRNRL